MADEALLGESKPTETDLRIELISLEERLLSGEQITLTALRGDVSTLLCSTNTAAMAAEAWTGAAAPGFERS